jgi:hypothetical protein
LFPIREKNKKREVIKGRRTKKHSIREKRNKVELTGDVDGGNQ